MIKLLIGGSPCTYWSIAQKNNRETEPSGLGWELFKNYLIAKEKFKPDFFLYENNKSAAKAIKEQIKKEFGVWDGTLFTQDNGVRYIEINSALVSAQNRQRFYVHNCGDVKQPEDRGILLKDILESGSDLSSNEKAYCLTARYDGAVAWNTIERAQRSMVIEPTRIPEYGNKDKARPLNALYPNNAGLSIEKRIYSDNPNKQQIDYIAEPIRVGEIGKGGQGYRVYSVDGKSVAQAATSGGIGSNTGLYAIPFEQPENYLGEKMVGYAYKEGTKNFKQRVKILADKACPLTTEQNKRAGTTNYIPQNVETVECEITTDGTKKNAKPIYEVKDGLITIKGKQYPIKLEDGYYIIRKLTVKECCRLQTMPDDYCKAVSSAQAYRGLGNGWTAEVIIHILNGALKNIPKDEEIVVLSMYDGIGTGRYCLDKMGFTNVKYYAYEIDKYAKQIAMSNYPDIIQMGDAFRVRDDNWGLKI